MARITQIRGSSPRGDFDYQVEWVDNDGAVDERYFNSHRAAVQFIVEVESKLLNEAVADFNATLASMSSKPARALKVKVG